MELRFQIIHADKGALCKLADGLSRAWPQVYKHRLLVGDRAVPFANSCCVFKNSTIWPTPCGSQEEVLYQKSFWHLQRLHPPPPNGGHLNSLHGVLPSKSRPPRHPRCVFPILRQRYSLIPPRAGAAAGSLLITTGRSRVRVLLFLPLGRVGHASGATGHGGRGGASGPSGPRGSALAGCVRLRSWQPGARE